MTKVDVTDPNHPANVTARKCIAIRAEIQELEKQREKINAQIKAKNVELTRANKEHGKELSKLGPN